MTPSEPSPAHFLSLEGKVALVTGGSGGLGREILAWFHAAGATTINVDLPGLETPDGSEALPCDLSDPEAIAALGDDIDSRFGRLDILVHAAGITKDGVLWKMTAEDWDKVLAVNLGAAFHLLKLAVPRMRQAGGGSIIFLSSINGERGKFGQANYTASKAGLIGLAKTAAREGGRFSIRVNVVAPGMILTPMSEGLSQEVLDRAVAETALGRLGRPADVAGATLFLASELSRHVTGQVLRVDGGQLIA